MNRLETDNDDVEDASDDAGDGPGPPSAGGRGRGRGRGLGG